MSVGAVGVRGSYSSTTVCGSKFCAECPHRYLRNSCREPDLVSDYEFSDM